MDLREVKGADAVGCCRGKVADLLGCEAHQACAECIHEHGILAEEHPVGPDRVAALLEIEVPADGVDDIEVRLHYRIEGRDGLREPAVVEFPLAPVGKAALQVLHAACHPGLAMALEDRQVDEVARIQGAAADVHGPEGGFHPAGLVVLQVVEGHIVVLAHLVVACGPEGPPGVVAHPGALDDADIGHPVVPQVLDGAGQHTGVGGGSALRGGGHHQVGLEGHRSPGRNLLDDLGTLHQGFCHLMGVGTENFINGRHKYAPLQWFRWDGSPPG